MEEEELTEALLGLIDKGLVTVEYDENLTAVFSITEEGKLAVEQSDFSK